LGRLCRPTTGRNFAVHLPHQHRAQRMKPSKKIKALYLAGFFGLLDWS